MDKASSPSFEGFYNRIKEILETARNKIYRIDNFEIILAYWQVGKSIVEEEQRGKEKAEYGKHLLMELAGRLSAEYGKAFDESNLRNMRKFYLTYPKRDALRPELMLTHYRILIRIEKDDAREFCV